MRRGGGDKKMNDMYQLKEEKKKSRVGIRLNLNKGCKEG